MGPVNHWIPFRIIGEDPVLKIEHYDDSDDP